MIHREYLDYYITYHCNLKCANCSVGSPYIDPTFQWDFDSFKNDIDNLSKYMRINKLRLIGGEPTLHPDIAEFMKYASESDLVLHGVAVATNGISLKSMSSEFWKYCQMAHISEYANTTINYDKIYKWLDDNNKPYKKVHELLRNSDFKDRCIEKHGKEWMDGVTPDLGTFRDLVVLEELDHDKAQEVYSACNMKDICHTFNNGKYYNCGFSIHRNFYYDSIGVKIPYDLNETDGIKIDDDDFEQNYHDLINSKEININACRWCKGFGENTSVKSENLPHRQLTVDEIQAEKIYH